MEAQLLELAATEGLSEWTKEAVRWSSRRWAKRAVGCSLHGVRAAKSHSPGAASARRRKPPRFGVESLLPVGFNWTMDIGDKARHAL
jgi:hypothetical protein